MSLTRQLVGLAVSIGVCFAVAAAGSAMTMPSIGTWYAALNKPSWNPPNWVFGPAYKAPTISCEAGDFLLWNQLIHGALVDDDCALGCMEAAQKRFQAGAF
ncbi:MAG TPA: TspO/MBR family protein, partial [Blastocatellia bacterium]|nr:TspO/MBR family protein [Blastocatellia bacterium]